MRCTSISFAERFLRPFFHRNLSPFIFFVGRRRAASLLIICCFFMSRAFVLEKTTVPMGRVWVCSRTHSTSTVPEGVDIAPPPIRWIQLIKHRTELIVYKFSGSAHNTQAADNLQSSRRHVFVCLHFDFISVVLLASFLESCVYDNDGAQLVMHKQTNKIIIKKKTSRKIFLEWHEVY